MGRGQKRQDEEVVQPVHGDKRACSSVVRPDPAADAQPSSSSTIAPPPSGDTVAAVEGGAASANAPAAAESGTAGTSTVQPDGPAVVQPDGVAVAQGDAAAGGDANGGDDDDGDHSDGSDGDDDGGGGGGDGDGGALSGRLTGIIAAMETGDPALLMPALTDVCEVLCFCQDGYDISRTTIEKLVPRLVETAGGDFGPEVMLLAVRAMEYLCDATDRAPAFLVQNAALPVLVGRLEAIEYLDVAEQCLQAIEKISFYQPVASLQAGAGNSCLTYLDFFSTTVQRVAVSAVLNMCWQFPMSCSKHVMEFVPTLCNLLQYQDTKVVETVVNCFSKIAKNLKTSPDLLDQLCKHDLVPRCIDMIPTEGQMGNVLSNHDDLFRLLSSLACGSPLAVKTLLELDISGKLRGMMLAQKDASSTTVGSKTSTLVLNVVKLLNQLLPSTVAEGEDAQSMQAKEVIFKEQPELLNKFAMDILPVSVQIVESGASVSLCYGIVSIINKSVQYCSSDLLLDAFSGTNISRFLASLLTCRDDHVLISVLETANNLLKKNHDIFLNQFMKEGVLFAIDRLLTQESTAKSSSAANPENPTQSAAKTTGHCLCQTFKLSPQQGACKVGKDVVVTLAKLIKKTHCNALTSFEAGSDVLNKLKTFCSVLDDNVLKNRNQAYSSVSEEYLSHILGQIMSEISANEALSTFELIESKISKSFINYLCNGQYLRRETENKFSPDHHLVIQSRVHSFASTVWSERCQNSGEPVVAVLVRKLQAALSSLDCFPVVPPNTTKLYYAGIPFERETTHPCFLALFTKDANDSVMREMPSKTVYIESSSTFDAIEEYLWPKVSPQETCDDDKPMMIETQLETSERMEAAESETDKCNLHCEDMKAEGTLPKDSAVLEAKQQTPVSSESVNENHAKDENSSKSPVAKPKLAFYLDGHELDRSLTLCQAILWLKSSADPFNVIGPEFWSMVYKITYKMVEPNHGNSPNSSETDMTANRNPQNWSAHSLSKFPWFSSLLVGKLPCSMEVSNPCYDVLFMLKILEGLNKFAVQLDYFPTKKQEMASRVLPDNGNVKVTPSVISDTDFLNTKLTGKLEQQMREPLVLYSNMPAWVDQLVGTCPFLFTFTARSKYFKLAISGSLQNQRSPLLEGHNASTSNRSQPTTHKKRAKIDRNDIMGSAEEVMKSYAGSKDILETEYNEEVGTGLGPTLEFYTLISHGFQKVGLGLWRGDNCCSSASHVSGELPMNSPCVAAPLGLFPRPWSELERTSNEVGFSEVLKKFKLFGWIIAKALKDGRILDLPLSKAFYKLISEQELDVYDISSFDHELGATLIEFQLLANEQKIMEHKGPRLHDLQFRGTRIEDLCIDFSVPGYPNYVLASRHAETVNSSNLGEYASLVVDATIGDGISRQMEAFKSGFDMVFPLKSLQIFSEKELERVLCGDQDICSGDMSDKIKFDHGYTASSSPILDLLEVMLELNSDQQRAFLQFVTGAPRLPPGGLASLNPKLTVVRKHCNGSPDDELPSVMTCANYLKLPPYSSKERLKEKLLYAITEGQGSFHLS